MQKLEFEVNNDINSKVSVWKGDITKLNFGALLNSVNKTLIGGVGIDGAIHEAAGPELVYECQKLNVCETCECNVTLGYRLPAEYLFHTVRIRDKNVYRKFLLIM